MEKAETSISFEDLKLDDFSTSTRKQIRIYALLLTVKKSEKPSFINQFLVSDLSINEECSYPIPYFDRGFQFKESIFVEPNQKFCVDLFDAKFNILNEYLSRLFGTNIPNPGIEFSRDLFNKKILVEITATIKRYKGQLDFSKAQMEPLTKKLLMKRAVTERDQPLIDFLNRLKVTISSEWVRSFDSMYGFSDILRRLNGVGYRQDNDSDILESQAPTFNKRRRINPMIEADPSRALLASILPNIKQEIMAEHSENEEKEEDQYTDFKPAATLVNTPIVANKIVHATTIARTNSETDGLTQTPNGNNTSIENDSSESRIIDPSSSHLIQNSTTSQIIAHSTQQFEEPFQTVKVVGWFPNDELKIKNVYTGEVEFDDSFEIFVKYLQEDVKSSEGYKPIGVIKFKSCTDLEVLFDKLASNGANDFNIKSIKIPTLEWKILFSKYTDRFSIYWDHNWDFQTS